MAHTKLAKWPTFQADTFLPEISRIYTAILANLALQPGHLAQAGLFLIGHYSSSLSGLWQATAEESGGPGPLAASIDWGKDLIRPKELRVNT